MAWPERVRSVSRHILSRTPRRAGAWAHRRNLAVVAGLLAGGLCMISLGCGNQYRPVITPIQPTGPAAQPTAQAVIMSQPGFTPISAGATSACNQTTYGTPSIITVLDFSGDAVVAQADGGFGPIGFSLDTTGSNIYAPNCDGTLTTAEATPNQLKSSTVQNSTLLPGAAPTNTLPLGSSLYVTETGRTSSCLATNCVAQMTSTGIQSLKQEIPVAPSLINLTGYSNSQRIYAISQGNSNGGSLKWGACDSPGTVAVDGEADAIETTTNTISARLPLGICPVYGFSTPDSLRTFIMNRGSNTVTVINSQLNAIDTNPNLGPNGTIQVGGGPVFADYYRQGQVLVTANYDGNSISIIDVSLDVYGNDSATFGKVLATIPVGPAGLHPVEVSVLQDGSRVYVANQGDMTTSPATPGSVTVVNLADYTVEKTIPLTANPHAIASIYNYPIGKVYVTSQNSPYLTIIRTDTDIISATPELQGNIIDLRVNTQYPGQTSGGAANYQLQSRSVGSGAP
jgi:hypothetical protein